tara:strand:- start:52 stop:291 length:240 start_codon:yes stop_codon:yes gene_type:complete
VIETQRTAAPVATTAELSEPANIALRDANLKTTKAKAVAQALFLQTINAQAAASAIVASLQTGMCFAVYSRLSTYVLSL